MDLELVLWLLGVSPPRFSIRAAFVTCLALSSNSLLSTPVQDAAFALLEPVSRMRKPQ